MVKTRFFVEATDNGVIITRYGREQNYDNPTGATVSFECDSVDNAILLTRMILGGQEEMRKSPVDLVIGVSKIYHLNKWQEKEDID